MFILGLILVCAGIALMLLGAAHQGKYEYHIPVFALILVTLGATCMFLGWIL